MIEDRSKVVAGVRLVARFKGKDYVCDVVAGEAGKLIFRVGDKEFTSPSAAGTEVMGHAANGWRFWTIAGASDEAPKAPRSRKAKAEPKAEAPKAPKARTVPASQRPPMPDDGGSYYWNKDGWKPKSQRKAVEPVAEQEEVAAVA